MTSSRGLLVIAAALALSATVLTVLFVWLMRFVAWKRRRVFLPSLGPVVRIATPCRVVRGGSLVPGTVGLTPQGLLWDAPFGLSNRVSFTGVKRLETDERLSSGRRLLKSRVLRVTIEDGGQQEFLLTRDDEWQWRRALGEWVGQNGRIATQSSVSRSGEERPHAHRESDQTR
jgi:hypothetical protein